MSVKFIRGGDVHLQTTDDSEILCDNIDARCLDGRRTSTALAPSAVLQQTNLEQQLVLHDSLDWLDKQV